MENFATLFIELLDVPLFLIGFVFTTFLTTVLWARHIFRVVVETRLLNADTAMKYAGGMVPMPGLHHNLYLGCFCRERDGGLLSPHPVTNSS